MNQRMANRSSSLISGVGDLPNSFYSERVLRYKQERAQDFT